MPAANDPGGDAGRSEGGAPPKLSFGQRILLVLPRVRHDRSDRKNEKKEPVSDWARRTFLKPEDPDKVRANTPAKSHSVDELEALVKRADDKERAIGLVAAPVAAAIGFLVIHALVVNDPAQHLKNGTLNPHYVNPSLYDDVFLVLLVLSLVMLTMAMLRKRLFLGVATALYGLAIFNLHYWGFGIPFIICAAWYLVRAYRLQRDLREATGVTPRYAARANDRKSSSSNTATRAPNKRYTPRSASSSRAIRPKPESGKNGKRAG
ncbi:MAG: hypothetical protein ACLP6E_12010 [Acidimicrobiales bacterium]